MGINLAKKIVEDLEKSGFPTEVAIASILETNKWMVYNGPLFEDNEENKCRELDIHAVNVDFSLMNRIKAKEGNENKLISHLIIEVKKSDKPWVFFDNGELKWFWLNPPKNYKSESEGFHDLSYEDLQEYGLQSHSRVKEKMHKSYHVSFSSPSQPSAIYEVLIKVTKALYFFKKQYGTGRYCLHLFIPIIVLDGTLWSASLDKKEKVNLRQVDNLLVTHGELLQYKKIKTKFEEEQIIEIVTKKAFHKRLKTIQNDIIEIYKCWTNYRIEEDKLR